MKATPLICFLILSVAYAGVVLPADPVSVFVGVSYGVLCFACGLLNARASRK